MIFGKFFSFKQPHTLRVSRELKLKMLSGRFTRFLQHDKYRCLRALRGPIDDESFSIVVPLKSSLSRYPYCPSFLENPLVSNSYTDREFEDNSNYKYSSEDLQV